MEPRHRAIPGCRRAPHTRQATATTPLRPGVAAPGGVEAPWHARQHGGRHPGGPAPGLGDRTQTRTAHPRGTAVRHGGRASASSRVPRKRPNQVEGGTTRRRREQAEAAAAVEGRERATGKTGEPTRGRAQRRSARQRALDRIRPAARRDHAQPLTALWPQGDDIHRLREAYDGLNREAAPGVDGQPWAASGAHLEAHRRDLSERLKRGASHARPVQRVAIPQPDGRPRPIGIPALDDTIVQRATVEVLNALDAGEWRGFSSGCRPGRRPPDALEAVTVGIEKRTGNGGLGAAIRGCFDAIDHAWLVKVIAHRSGDQRVVRPRPKGRHAGVLEEGPWHAQAEGPPQGGRVSPLAAPISRHDVLDLWADRWRRQHARGEGIIVRYAADFLVGFAHRDAAARVGSARRARMSTCNLELHPEKTRLIEVGRFAADRRRRRAQGQPAPFPFLGLTPRGSPPRKGKWTVRRKTIAQRLRKKLHAIKETRRLPWPIPQQGAWLQSVRLGHSRSYGVPRNGSLLTVGRDTMRRYGCQRLRRRRQRHRMLWPRMDALAEPWLPQPHILHPYPAQRLRGTTRGKSPVRSCRTPGSVRGVLGNWYPYRDLPPSKSYVEGNLSRVTGHR